MGAAAVANLHCLRTEPELSRLEELNLLDVVFSFGFLVFFLVEEADFFWAVSESVVIVEVSASVPKPSWYRMVQAWVAHFGSLCDTHNPTLGLFSRTF